MAIAGFLGILFSLVILHELGHYLAARKFGVVPRSFSIGMGPEIAAIEDKSGTRWKFCVLPLGGYVKFKGAMHPDEETDHGDFASLPRGKRAIIIAAGPFINFLAAAAIFLGVALWQGVPYADRTIIAVESGSPAERAGLQPGDQIIAWNGESSPDMRRILRRIKIEAGGTEDVTVLRDGNRKDFKVDVVPKIYNDRFGNQSRIGMIGFKLETGMRPVEGVSDILGVSIVETKEILELQVKSLGQIISGERNLTEISGPVRMAKTSGEQLQIGWENYLYFAAIISIAIGFMNLLPIPGLDGGYLAIYAFEAVNGKNLKGQSIKSMMLTGYVAVGALAVFAFYNDLSVILGD